MKHNILHVVVGLALAGCAQPSGKSLPPATRPPLVGLTAAQLPGFRADEAYQELLVYGCVPSAPSRADLVVSQEAVGNSSVRLKIATRRGALVFQRDYGPWDQEGEVSDDIDDLVRTVGPRYQRNRSYFSR